MGHNRVKSGNVEIQYLKKIKMLDSTCNVMVQSEEKSKKR